MSEYQYYEFQAVDRLLGEIEMSELRGYSSRAQITPASFINEYSYGSFKGDRGLWMEKYFDAFLYLANWGTHELQLRVPAKLLPLATAQLYCPENDSESGSSVRQKNGNLIFTFVSQSDGGEWVEIAGVLASFLPLREELRRGDLRVLYLGWLLGAHERDESDLEPPVPPGLGKLTPALRKFAEFLRVDPDLLTVAAKASLDQRADPTESKLMANWVSALPAKEKDAILIRLIKGEESNVGSELASRFRRSQKTDDSTVKQQRRTVGILLAAAAKLDKNR